MKKLSYILFVVIINLFLLSEVGASSCTDLYGNTTTSNCVTLCKYSYIVPENTYVNYIGTGNYTAGLYTYYSKEQIYVQIDYLTAENSFRVMAYDASETGTNAYRNTITTIKNNSDDEMVTSSDIFLTIENFVCPLNGYLDTTGINNEVCFDNDGLYCVGDGENAGTDFGISWYYESTTSFTKILNVNFSKKTYDFETGISFLQNTTITKAAVEDYYDKFLEEAEEIYASSKTDAEKSAEVAELITEYTAEQNTTENTILMQSLIDGVIEDHDIEWQKTNTMLNLFYNTTGYKNRNIAIISSINSLIESYFGSDFNGGSGLASIIADHQELTEEEVEDVMDNIADNTGSVDDLVYIADYYEYTLNGGVFYEKLDCEGDEGLLGDPTDSAYPAYYLQTALDILRYVGIVALIGLSTIDYVKAVSSNDADALKTANKKALKRLLYTVILFIFPSILEFIFDLTGIYGNGVDPFCGLT